MIFGLIIWMIIIMIVVWLLVSNIRIVPQAHAYVVERLGGYRRHGALDYILRCRSLTVWQKEFP